MMNWLFGERKKRDLPESWGGILSRNAPFRERLDEDLREDLDQRIIEFVEAKNWEGCNGLEVLDEHKVTIAAHALRLVLAYEKETFHGVKSVLIYPTAYEAKSTEVLGGNVVIEGGVSQRAGESWYRGPVIFDWSDIVSCLHDETGWHRYPRNVVLHEFAHQIDYQNGRAADGMPPLSSTQEVERWKEVTDAAYERLCRACERGQRTLFDCYGTTNRAEFFAVTTEAYFEAGADFAMQWPELYEVMKGFYRQETRV